MSFPPLETLSTILPPLSLYFANIDTNLTSATKPFLTSILKLLEHLASYMTLAFSICYLPPVRFNTGEIYRGTSALFSSGKAFSFSMGWICNTKHLKGSENHSVLTDSLQPHRLYRPWISPGQNTGVGSLSLLQGIFPTQGLNLGLPHCRRILYQLSYRGSPRILEWVAYPFSNRSSRPRNGTRVSWIAGGFFTNWAIQEALKGSKLKLNSFFKASIKFFLAFLFSFFLKFFTLYWSIAS